MQFAIIDAQTGFAVNRCPQHGHAVRGRYQRLLPVRRAGGGNQTDFIEVEQLAEFNGGAQVTDVDRIEGAAENADAAQDSLTPPTALRLAA